MKEKVLFCFTASYPYGLKETFFDNELPYLSKSFDKVVIFPRYNPSNSVQKREMPDNVVCHAPLVSANKRSRIVQGILNTSPLIYHFREFFRLRLFKSRDCFEKWLNSLLVFRASYVRLKNYLKKCDGRDIVLYSYWAEAPLFLTKLCSPYKKVVRMHRGDYYVEENNGYLPLRREIYTASDLLIPISEHIYNDLIITYGIEETKVQLHRLGVSNTLENNANTDSRTPNNVIRIVSCSRVDPVKRVHLISDALALYEGDKKIEWHHFGDGLEFEELKKKIKTLNKKKIAVILHGWATQADILKFYELYFVNWFVNVSESEGIPVSIMEAMSFGIPVIATDVGGTSEIVNTDTGYLLKKSFDICTLLNCILSDDFEKYVSKRKAARQMWSENYKAETNYLKLSSALRKLL